MPSSSSSLINILAAFAGQGARSRNALLKSNRAGCRRKHHLAQRIALERTSGVLQFSAEWSKRVLFGCSELPLLTRCRSAVRVCSPERSVTCEEAGRYNGKVGCFGSEAYARGNKNTGRAFDKLERMEPFVSRVTSAIVGCQGLAAGSTTFDPGRQTAISISEELHL
jgi:hypothetical protein